MNLTNATKELEGFITLAQLRVMMSGCRGEEGQFFRDKFEELGQRIATMPKTYEQDGRGDDTIFYLHYFRAGADCWISERDIGTPEEPGQHQAFGVADLGYGGELGYISLVEWLDNEAELDLHFAPQTKRELFGVAG